MNKIIPFGATILVGLVLSADSFAEAPKGAANPFNVDTFANAAVSPDGSGTTFKERRQLKQLHSLQFLSQKLITQLDLRIDDVNGKLDELREELEEADSDGDADDLEKQIESQEEQLQQLEKLKEIFQQKLILITAQIAALQDN